MKSAIKFSKNFAAVCAIIFLFALAYVGVITFIGGNVQAQLKPPSGKGATGAKGSTGSTGATGPICGSTTQVIVNLNGACSGSFYPASLVTTPTLSTGTTSGTVGYVGINATNGLAFNNTAVRYLLFDRTCNVQRVSVYSDVGPGGIANAATETIALVAFSFAPGTASNWALASYALVDSSINITATGLTPFNSVITSFSTSPLTIPANSLLAWRSTVGGGTATTNAMNLGMSFTCE